MGLGLGVVGCTATGLCAAEAAGQGLESLGMSGSSCFTTPGTLLVVLVVQCYLRSYRLHMRKLQEVP